MVANVVEIGFTNLMKPAAFCRDVMNGCDDFGFDVLVRCVEEGTFENIYEVECDELDGIFMAGMVVMRMKVNIESLLN